MDAVFNGFTDPTDVTRHDGKTRSHGLENGQGETLFVGGENKDRARREALCDVSSPSGKTDPL
jgi:hypothetical protein